MTTYTHQDIAHWCDRFHMSFIYGDLTDDGVLKSFAEVAEDVSVQWDLSLSNTYSLEQLQALDFSKIELPKQWFKNWYERVKHLLS